MLIDRSELDRAALKLLTRHGAQIMATARRYAATPEDAEDAYQRGLEILLTKAPTTREQELVPWLKTVVKHEAFALRRQRDRLTPVTGDGEPHERGTAPTATHEQAARYERLSQGAEALRRLKPQEIRCLVLKAQGLSYREICEVTGWTYTKVNRCLTEGRQALTVQLAGIEGGIECRRLTPLLSALADGEATAEQLAVLRPHMRTCLACRARLREFRAAPARVAALAPAAALAAGDGAGPSRLELFVGAVQQKTEALLGAAQHKAAALGERAHTAVELAAGQKATALAASAAALAGGGTAVDQLANHRGPPPSQTRVHAQQTAPVETEPAAPAPTTPPPPTAEQPPPTDPTTSPPPPPDPPPPPPQPANEFSPAGTSATTQPAQPEPAPAPTVAPGPAAARARAAPSAPVSSSAPGGEFAP